MSKILIPTAHNNKYEYTFHHTCIPIIPTYIVRIIPVIPKRSIFKVKLK